MCVRLENENIKPRQCTEAEKEATPEIRIILGDNTNFNLRCLEVCREDRGQTGDGDLSKYKKLHLVNNNKP